MNSDSTISGKPSRRLLSQTDRSNIRWIWQRYLRAKAPWLALVLVMILGQGIVYQQFLRLSEDGLRVIFERGQASDLLWVCAIVFGIFVLRGVLSFLVPRIAAWVAADAVNQLRTDLIAHLMRLDLAFFDRTPAGEIILRLTQQAESLSTFAGRGLVRAVRDASTMLIISAYLLWKQPILFIASLLILPPILWALQRISQWMKRSQRSAQAAMGDYMSGLEETIGGMRTVKISGQEASETSRMVQMARFIRKYAIRVQTANAAVAPFIDFAAAFVFVLVIGGGGYMVLSADFDVDGPGILAFLIGLVLVFDPGRRLSTFFVMLQGNLVILEKVRSLFRELPTVQEPEHPVGSWDTGGDIDFRDVAFSYGSHSGIFTNLNLHFKGGQTTAIVGPTGSGKSTILTLLGRLYEPESGEITIGGAPLNQIALSELRAAFSVVAQDIVIFNNSVWENIRYVRPDAEESEIWAAAENAEIAELIRTRGDEPVGPKGAQLSGGQKQRIAIARAFLRDAPILLLDEATSALDQATEDRITGAFDRLSKGKTAIVIAHRLSAVTDADHIYVLESGRVAEAGTHADLLAKGGLYAQLFETQRQGYEATDAET